MIVGVDTVPPVTGITRPQVGRTQVRPNVRIRMDVWDFGAGIDVQASEMLINGSVVPRFARGQRDPAAFRVLAVASRSPVWCRSGCARAIAPRR